MFEEGTVVAQEIQAQYGKISIREEVIATISGVAAMECYGLVGMAPRSIQDELTDLLRRENFERGVDIQFNEDSVTIQLYIVVEYGVKISEVARNVQERVKYAVETMLGLNVDAVNVKVQSVRVTSAKRK
ncbi:MAG TPA: Asp23/Gls24 family envelope stress response protein [Firmicutes bacterium]|nr:Asp23/Gls24 family envelope stress response protein [Bacillota bacterium]